MYCPKTKYTEPTGSCFNSFKASLESEALLALPVIGGTPLSIIQQFFASGVSFSFSELQELQCNRKLVEARLQAKLPGFCCRRVGATAGCRGCLKQGLVMPAMHPLAGKWCRTTPPAPAMAPGQAACKTADCQQPGPSAASGTEASHSSANQIEISEHHLYCSNTLRKGSC